MMNKSDDESNNRTVERNEVDSDNTMLRESLQVIGFRQPITKSVGLQLRIEMTLGHFVVGRSQLLLVVRWKFTELQIITLFAQYVKAFIKRKLAQSRGVAAWQVVCTEW